MTGGKKKTERKAADVLPLRPPRKCPICGKAATRAAYPFCSRRCSEIDLGRWLTGAYAIPVVESDEDPEQEPGDDDDRGEAGHHRRR